MTTFTTIPNASLEPGKPIRSIDGLALRDNPIAMFEGDASAPRIVGKAAKRLQDYPVLTVSAADAYDASIGSNPEIVTSITSSTASPPTVVSQRYTIAKYTGVMRFKILHQGNSYTIFETATVAITSTLSIYKNGSLIQSYTKTDVGFVQRTNDVSVVPGDVIEWRHRTNDPSGSSATSSPSITASGAYTARPLYISQSDLPNP